jgi:uncharacterized damage-inducible protein DinB
MTPTRSHTGMAAVEVDAACPHPVVAAALAMLDQCDEFVRMVDDPAYVAESRTIAGGTIGKHVRHVLDHFRAALAGHAVIDYDRRARNVPMETDRREAFAAIEALRRRMRALDAGALEGPVRVRVMLSADGSSGVLTSTLGRELAFAAHHAVHHHAMLRAIGAEFGISVGPDFGKAPSTLHSEGPSL